MASYSKTYSGDLTSHIVGKIFNAANMAKEEKQKQEEDRKQGLEVTDRGNLYAHALRSEFGGDLYSRTIGVFDPNRSHEQTDRQSNKANRFSANFYRQKRESQGDTDTETKKSSDLLDDALKNLNQEDKESIPVKDIGLRSYVSKVFGVGIDARLISLENKTNQSLAAIRDIRTLNEGNMNLMVEYNDLIATKLDVILSLYKEQFSYQKKVEDDLESKKTADELSKSEILSGSEKYTKSASPGGRTGSLGIGPLSRYFIKRAARRQVAKVLKRVPKSQRRAILKAKNFPNDVKTRLTSRLPTAARQASQTLSRVKSLGQIGRAAGPARYIFAGIEYGQRRGAGQTQLQATSGVASGLAGAAAGGVAGAKGGASIGATIGAFFGGVGAGPGALIGGAIGGISGSIVGGLAASKASDKITGAYETGTGYTRPGTAMLHGTEMYESVDPRTGMPTWAINKIGSALVSTSMKLATETGVKNQIQGDISKLPFDVTNIPQTLSVSYKRSIGVRKQETFLSSLMMNPADFLQNTFSKKGLSEENPDITPPPTEELQIIPGNGTIRSGAEVTQRNDRDNEQTGSDIAIKDPSGGYGVGAIIQNPFSSMRIKKVGFQGSGSGATGTGFGLYVVGAVNINDKEYEVLLGHLNKSHVKAGDILGTGDSIGEQGISGHATGPHVSTHVNSMENDVVAAGRVLTAIENAWVRGSSIQSKSFGTTTVQANTATLSQAQAFKKVKDAAAAAGSPNPDVTAAIAMLETGWLSNPNSVYFASGKTNPFGQTGRHPVTGKYVVAKDGEDSIVYGSFEEGVRDHVNRWKDAYVGSTPKEMIENIRTNTGKMYNMYNTNPDWTNKVYSMYKSGTNALSTQSSSRRTVTPSSIYKWPGTGGGDRGAEAGSRASRYGASLPFRSPIPGYPNYQKPTDQYGAFFAKIYKLAEDAGDPFPEIVAAQAVEESNFGKSQIAREAFNLFGQDAPSDAPASRKYTYFDEIEQQTHHAYKFASFADSVKYRVRIWKKFYGSAKTPAEAIRNIAAAGYNPHAEYPSKIIQLLRNYGIEPDKNRPIAPRVGPRKVGTGVPFIPDLTIKKVLKEVFKKSPQQTSSMYQSRGNQVASNLELNSQVLDDIENNETAMIQFVVLNNNVVDQAESSFNTGRTSNMAFNKTNLKMQILAS